MKIVYNILGLYVTGGMERIVCDKANYFASLGHDVTIITLDQKGKDSYYELDDRIKLIDLGVCYEEDVDGGFIARGKAFFSKRKKHKQRLKEVLYKLKADIVISTFGQEALFLYRIKDGSKKIIETHANRECYFILYTRKGIWGIIDLCKYYLDKFSVLKYDRFVVLTEEDKHLWGDLPNIEVIPNSNTFESSEHSELNSKVAIAVGRYEKQKAFDELIRVWSIVNKAHPDWRLNIFGEGSQKEYLQGLIGELGLSSVVKLHPPTKDIKSEYLKSSFLVMTSVFEGLPMTLLEAQVLGLPMVSYACKCGPRDIIRDGENGFLIENRDCSEMVRRIIDLIENEELRKRMGRKSVEHSETFSREKVMSKWIDLFNRLITEK